MLDKLHQTSLNYTKLWDFWRPYFFDKASYIQCHKPTVKPPNLAVWWIHLGFRRMLQKLGCIVGFATVVDSSWSYGAFWVLMGNQSQNQPQVQEIPCRDSPAVQHSWDIRVRKGTWSFARCHPDKPFVQIWPFAHTHRRCGYQDQANWVDLKKHVIFWASEL